MVLDFRPGSTIRPEGSNHRCEDTSAICSLRPHREVVLAPCQRGECVLDQHVLWRCSVQVLVLVLVQAADVLKSYTFPNRESSAPPCDAWRCVCPCERCDFVVMTSLWSEAAAGGGRANAALGGVLIRAAVWLNVAALQLACKKMNPVWSHASETGRGAAVVPLGLMASCQRLDPRVWSLVFCFNNRKKSPTIKTLNIYHKM